MITVKKGAMGQKLTVIKEGADSGLTGRLGTWGWVVRVPGVEAPAQLGGAGSGLPGLAGVLAGAPLASRHGARDGHGRDPE